MSEMAYHRRKDGCAVVLSRNGKYVVAVYNRSDIQEWEEEFEHEDEAWRRYKTAREETLV